LFLRLFLRTIRQHLGFHLLIPLMVTLVIWGSFELAHAVWESHAFTWTAIAAQFSKQNPDLKHLILELISVYFAFLVVVAISVWHASDVRWALVGVLEDMLPDTSRYFAIGTIPLREWFEPNTQVYLATIIHHQIERRIQKITDPNAPDFQHERVLLFQNANDIRAVQASYLDQHYARSFEAVHDRFDIPLAYLEPDGVKAVISDMQGAIPPSLLDYPWFARPRRLWGKLKISGIPRLRPFALIEQTKQSRVMLFVKGGNTLSVGELKDPADVAACKTIVNLIEQKIYNESGQLKNEFKFSRFLRP